MLNAQAGKKKLRALKIKREKKLQKLLYSFSSAHCVFFYLPPLFILFPSRLFRGRALVTCDAAAHLKNCPGEKLQLSLLVKEYAVPLRHPQWWVRHGSLVMPASNWQRIIPSEVQFLVGPQRCTLV